MEILAPIKSIISTDPSCQFKFFRKISAKSPVELRHLTCLTLSG